MSYDVIVIGLGGMGSAAACHLAARGQRVLGLERFSAPHDHGSSHGNTRVIRQSYYEDPAYVPLLLRAYELWRKLERETGTFLLRETGGLMIGSPDSDVFTGSLHSAQHYGLAHEILDAPTLRRRYPPLQPAKDTLALFEKRAGFVRPEAAVQAHLDLAKVNGADIHFDEPVISWEPRAGHVLVTTSRGQYEAGQVVITPGPWAPQLLAGLDLPLVVERQVLYWFDPHGGVEPFLPERFPIFIWEDLGQSPFYGLPATDGPAGGVKVAFYRAPHEERCHPDTVDRQIREAEIDLMRQTIAPCLPALDSRCLTAKTCLYTNTPDKNFIIATHPHYPSVSVACGFSGHGFKFCSVVGEILADLAIAGETRHDIALFHPQRLRR
jgi:sarcosine oxidase